MSEADRYQVNPLDGPAAMAEKLRDLERRLAALEGAPMVGSNLTAYDLDRNQLVAVGVLPDGRHGFQVLSAAGRVIFEVTSEDGQTVPQQTIPVQFGSPNTVNPLRLSGTSDGFRPGTSLGTFQVIWQALWVSVGPYVDYDIGVYPNYETMEWQITCNEVGGTGRVVVGPTGEAVNATRSGTFTIPDDCLVQGTGTDPLGRLMYLAFEARMTTGVSPHTVDILMQSIPFNHA